MKRTVQPKASQTRTSQSGSRRAGTREGQGNAPQTGHLAEVAGSINNSSQIRALTEMSAWMNPDSASQMTPAQAHAAPTQLVQVMQCKFKCNNCNAEYEKMPRKQTCTKCGSVDDFTEEAERPTFGEWWDGLGDDRRQELLRAHGSHEQHGGSQQKDKGGGPRKGDQHDTGVANAMRQIREKYDSGRLG